MTRRVVAAVVAVAIVLLVVLAPYFAGLIAEARVRALVTALDAAGGDAFSLRLKAYDRGYATSAATLELTIDVPMLASTFEVPFAVGHGPIPIGDVFAGRSGMRLCAGFASFDVPRGRGPTGISLVPVHGRVVLGALGGIAGELVMRPDDIKPLTPRGSASDARITLTGDVGEFTFDAYVGEWRDPRHDAPSSEIGGARVVLTFAPGHVERRFELARLAHGRGRAQRTIEQLELTHRVRAAESELSLRARFVRDTDDARTLSMREPSFTWSSRGAGEARVAVAFAGLSGTGGALDRSSFRGKVRIGAAAIERVATALAAALATPAPAPPRPRPADAGPDAPAPPPVAVRTFDVSSLALALTARDDDPRIVAVVSALRASLRTGPSLALDVDVLGDDRTPSARGRFALRVDPAEVEGAADLRALMYALVLEIDAWLSRDVVLAVARSEVERRAAELITADEAERRDALVLDVVQGASDAAAITPRDGGYVVRATVPLAAPSRATLADRPLDAYRATPLGIALRRAEMPRVRIALGTVVSSGEITDGNVILAIAPRARDLRLCAEAELLDAQPVLEGDVQVWIGVGPTGAVVDARVLADTIGDESLAACFVDVFRALPLPASRRGGSSVVPVHVTRGGALSLDAVLESMGAPPPVVLPPVEERLAAPPTPEQDAGAPPEGAGAPPPSEP